MVVVAAKRLVVVAARGLVVVVARGLVVEVAARGLVVVVAARGLVVVVAARGLVVVAARGLVVVVAARGLVVEVAARGLVVVVARGLMVARGLVVVGGGGLSWRLGFESSPLPLLHLLAPREHNLAGQMGDLQGPGPRGGVGALRCREAMADGASAPFRTGVSGGEQSLGSLSWSPFSTREVRSFSLSWWLLLWAAIFCRDTVL